MIHVKTLFMVLSKVGQYGWKSELPDTCSESLTYQIKKKKHRYSGLGSGTR
jgi:hypothetical protein